MELVERFTSLPKGRPGWATFGRTAAGEMRALGEAPRLTLGERLLGRYSSFMQVDLNHRTAEVAFEARSATGRKAFSIRLEVDYRVREPDIVAAGQGTLDQAVIVPMKRLAAAEATEVEAPDYIELQYRLSDKLDPNRTGQAVRGPFEVTAVAVTVDPPKDIKLNTEARETLRDIEMRHVEALATGDTATAQNLLRAMEAMETLRHHGASTLQSRATNAIKIKQAIQELLETGEPRDSNTIRALEKQLETYARGDAADEASRPAVEHRRETPGGGPSPDAPRDRD